MKFATRISSIRRTAWKACRSCSPASDSMCARSLASHRDAGCTRSPRSASTRVTGSWVSQSISRSGCRSRSSSAIARSRRTCPSPIGERDEQRPLAPVPRPGSRSAGRGGGGVSDSTNSRISRLARTGSRSVGACPPPSDGHQVARRSTRASATPVSYGTIPSWSPCTTSTGQRTCRQVASASAAVGVVHARAGEQQRLARRSPAPTRRRPPTAWSSAAR